MRASLLCLLLLAPVAWGQDEPRMEIMTEYDGPAYVRFSPIVRDSLCSWWDQYSAECYADSTRQDRVKAYRMDDPGVCVGYWDDTTVTLYMMDGVDTKPRYWWAHRVPDFPGFMAWLKRRGR